MALSSVVEPRAHGPRQATSSEEFLALELKLAPEIIVQHVSSLRGLLRVAEREVICAVVACPQLLRLSPSAIDRRVSKAALTLGIMKPRFAVAAMRSPLLLAIPLAQLKRRLPLVMQLAKSLDQTTTAADVLDEYPVAFTYAVSQLRSFLSRLTNGSGHEDLTEVLQSGSVRSPVLQASWAAETTPNQSKWVAKAAGSHPLRCSSFRVRDIAERKFTQISSR